MRYVDVTCILIATSEMSESEIFLNNHANVKRRVLLFAGRESGPDLRDGDEQTLHNDCWAIWWRQDSCHPDLCQGPNIPRTNHEVVRSESQGEGL